MSTSSTLIPAGSLVLVTGVTGFLASHITKELLKRGFRIRGTVRDVSKSSWITEGFFKSYADSGALEVVSVPDMAVPGAYDEAVKGVSAILHIAYITRIVPDPNEVVTPSVTGMRSILEAASREPSVKRVVFTSTAVTSSPLTVGVDLGKIGHDSWNDAVLETAWAPPPYGMSHAMANYPASKVAAEKELWKFVEEKKPAFTVNVVSPSSLIGEPLTEGHVNGQASWIAHAYRGNKQSLAAIETSIFVDVKDAASIHVGAVLDPEVTNKRLLSWGHNANLNEILAILRKLRPEKTFIDDLPNPQHLQMSPDESDALALLKKWSDSNKEGWTPLEVTISENINNPLFTE